MKLLIFVLPFTEGIRLEVLFCFFAGNFSRFNGITMCLLFESY